MKRYPIWRGLMCEAELRDVTGPDNLWERHEATGRKVCYASIRIPFLLYRVLEWYIRWRGRCAAIDAQATR
jgi:hypothetical protein